MKLTATYGDLSAKINELNRFAQMFPTVCQFLGGRYESFQKNNSVYIGLLNEKSVAIWEENVEKEDGKYKFNDKGEPEHISAAHAQIFDDKMKELMAKPCTIIV